VSAARIDFQNPSPTGGIWHSLNRFLFTLIVLTVAALVCYRFLPEVSKRRDQQARVEELKAEVEKERQLLVLNTRKKELLNYDAEYLGLVARDRLDLMKEGETIYRLDPPKPDKNKMRLSR
jgi:cell division protein FtsB